MSEANDKRLYNHFKNLIAGNFKGGNSVSRDLIISNAERNLKDLVSKRPNIIFEEAKEEVIESKSKGKK